MVEIFDYKRFFSLSVDMLCVVSAEGHFLAVNESFSRVLGYDCDQLLTHAVFDFIHPNDIEPTNQELARLALGEPTLDFTNRYRHADGHFITMSWYGQTDPENGLIYAVARDVTAEKNQTNRLKQIERGLSEKTILATTDSAGIITDVNDHFCTVSGYSRNELIGNTHRIINSGHHPKAFFDALWKTISGGDIWSGVITNRTKTGEYYMVQTAIIPILDHESIISSYLAIRQDITSSIQSKTDLSKTLEVLREIASIAKVGGWEMDVATQKLTWTDETFRILQVEKSADLQPSLPDGLQLFTPEYLPVIEQAINEAITLGRPYALEVEALTAEGNILWVHTTGKAKYENGKVVTLTGTIQDIDARKKSEMSFNLERQKGIQSAKLASLGELAASMAHEINNPLGIISGYTELIIESNPQASPASSKLDIILKSCDRIKHIVSNLMRFSRINETSEHKEILLSNTINEAIFLASTRLKRERVKLHFTEDNTANIMGNEIEIEQVILNLINNSIDALIDIQDKWIHLSIDTSEDQVYFRIKDAGPGIPENLRKKIFLPFYTTKSIDKGTGLGLSVIEGILKDHDTSLVYDSESQNTSFTINFPKMEALS